MFDSPREMYGLLQEKCGRSGAAAVFYLVVAGGAAVGLLGLGTLVWNVNQYVVTPLIAIAPRVSGTGGPNLRSVAISIGVTLLLLAGAIRILVIRFRKWEDILSDFMSQHAQHVGARLTHIEQNAADFKTCNDAVLDLHGRVVSLEILSGRGPQTHKGALIHRLRGPEQTVRHVGTEPPQTP